MRQTVKDMALAAVCGVVFVGATGGAVAQQEEPVKTEKAVEKAAHKAEMSEKKADHAAKDMAYEAKEKEHKMEEKPNL